MIRGSFRAWAESRFPVVGVRVSLSTLDLASSEDINFVIDTGASTTCLHPLDAVLVGIPFAQLESSGSWTRIEVRTGVGGGARYFVVPAIYGFEDEDGNIQSYEDDIRVAQFSSASAELPSLLGWDVLQHFRIGMDWREDEVWLE